MKVNITFHISLGFAWRLILANILWMADIGHYNFSDLSGLVKFRLRVCCLGDGFFTASIAIAQSVGKQGDH
jgi:hypothetical protein